MKHNASRHANHVDTNENASQANVFLNQAMLGSELVHINFEQMQSRKGNHKGIEQDRMIQNSTAVQYHTMDKDRGGDMKGAKLKQQLKSSSNPSLRNPPAGGQGAYNRRSDSVTVDPMQVAQMASSQGKHHKMSFINPDHLHQHQFLNPAQDSNEMANLPPILKNQNNLITRNQGTLHNSSQSNAQHPGGANQFSKMHKRIETQNPYSQVGAFSTGPKQQTIRADHSNSMKHVSPFLQSPPNIQHHSPSPTSKDHHLHTQPEAYMMQSHPNYHPNMLKQSPTGSQSPGPIKAFPTPSNSTGPLLNLQDMPEGHASLDQGGAGGANSPTHAEGRESENTAEDDMQMFVQNFSRAVETEKKHEQMLSLKRIRLHHKVLAKVSFNAYKFIIECSVIRTVYEK